MLKPPAPREQLIGLLGHYLQTALTGAGITWRGANDEDVSDMARAIEEMIKVEVEAAMEQHRENQPHLHRDGSEY